MIDITSLELVYRSLTEQAIVWIDRYRDAFHICKQHSKHHTLHIDSMIMRAHILFCIVVGNQFVFNLLQVKFWRNSLSGFCFLTCQEHSGSIKMVGIAQNGKVAVSGPQMEQSELLIWSGTCIGVIACELDGDPIHSHSSLDSVCLMCVCYLICWTFRLSKEVKSVC